MKTMIAMSLLTLTGLASSAYIPPQAGINKHGLRYKSHEFEYGSGDERVRALVSDDRGSVMKLLEDSVSKGRVVRADLQLICLYSDL